MNVSKLRDRGAGKFLNYAVELSIEYKRKAAYLLHTYNANHLYYI